MTWGRHTWGYLKNAARAVPLRPALAADCVRYYIPWLRSMSSSRDPLEEGRPWLPFAAARFLAEIVTGAWRVFEYGSGASTLFFARRAGRVHSVEHDPEWHRKVSAAIARGGFSNCRHDLVPPGPEPEGGPCPTGYSGSGYPGLSFERYARAVEAHEDGGLDLVVVDGRSRNACIWHARAKVAPGGHLLLDNSEREAYRPGMDLLREWRRRDFFGPCPGIGYFSRATLYRKPPA